MYKTTFQKITYFIYRSLNKIITSRNVFGKLLLTVLVFILSANGVPDLATIKHNNFNNWEWELIRANSSDQNMWSARAGLQALNHRGKFYVLGGRTPIESEVFGASIIHGDVWRSRDKGKTWKNILPSNPPFPAPQQHWANRAYFQAVSQGKYMYVLGGQDFNVVTNPGCEALVLPPGVPCPLPDIPFSQFFNDVWRSTDGIHWEQRTSPIPAQVKNRWSPRAGASAVSFKGDLYIMGGSLNDDAAIDGGAPERIYFNDVWRSKNGGKTWKNMTKNMDPDSRWSPRAGGIAVVKGDYMYMIGGEEGFLCPFDPTFPPDAQPPCLDPPYFNDVWRSKDGRNWELVTDDAGWAPRPGHQVVVANGNFVLFGGFGLLENPQDVWVSKNGEVWDKLDKGPWDDADSDQIKYDFDAVVVKGYGKQKDAIYTFGGDREVFDFTGSIPDNYKQVDNDVWKFALPPEAPEEDVDEIVLTLQPNYPNPFRGTTNMKYSIPERSYVSIKVYDKNGRFVSTLVGKTQNSGEYECSWNGKTYRNRSAKGGYYYAVLWSRGKAKTIKMYKK